MSIPMANEFEFTEDQMLYRLTCIADDPLVDDKAIWYFFAGSFEEAYQVALAWVKSSHHKLFISELHEFSNKSTLFYWVADSESELKVEQSEEFREIISVSNDFEKLSSRTHNSLDRAGLDNLEKLTRAIRQYGLIEDHWSGRFRFGEKDANGEDRPRKFREVSGKGCWKEICNLLDAQKFEWRRYVLRWVIRKAKKNAETGPV